MNKMILVCGSQSNSRTRCRFGNASVFVRCDDDAPKTSVINSAIRAALDYRNMDCEQRGRQGQNLVVSCFEPAFDQPTPPGSVSGG